MKNDKNKSPYLLTFVNNLKFLRNKFGLSQTELAKRLNIHQVSLSSYENGKSSPDLTLVVDTSKYFGITIDDILHVTLNDKNFPSQIYDFENYSAKLKHELFWDRRDDVLRRFAEKQYFCYYNNTDDKGLLLKEGVITTKSIENPSFIEIEANISGYTYSGNLLVPSEFFLYIYMNCQRRHERCFIVMPYMYSNKPYIGGMGCCVSISTGDSPKPCFQNILLSIVKLGNDDLKKFEEFFLIETDSKRVFFNRKNDNDAYNEIKYLYKKTEK